MKRKYLIGLHVLIWLLLIVNDTYTGFALGSYRSYSGSLQGAALLGWYFLIVLGFNSINALCFYGSYWLVAPPLFARKLYWRAIGMAMLLLALLVAWRYIVEFYFFIPVLGYDNYFHRPVSPQYYIGNVFWYYYPKYFVYGLMYFFVENWTRNRNRQEALQKENLLTELAFLRSQINPHFLFNTINDIYVLTYQRSDQAPEALLKLSELLRYMLREGAHDFVPLKSEIAYLNNLIELQRIGAKGNAFIDFKIDGPVETQIVAPLLFVAFIENAFKHGVLTDAGEPVTILLKIAETSIKLTVRNKINRNQKDQTGGIGLQNVKRRLELLYPEKHTLSISNNQHYTVHLTLNL